MSTSNRTIVVFSIDNQGDRVLLYGENDPRYYVITSPEQAKDVKEGDTIEYEPYGGNFGWFVSKK